VPRHTAEEAAATRRTIIEEAVRIASTDGLEGATLGRVAAEAHVSKPGLLHHFTGKVDLQLAALDEAVAIFRASVWDPVAALAPGGERLTALMESWITYLEGDVFPGGCFLTAASTEWDGRGGPVRSQVKATLDLWHSVLVGEARAAGYDDPEQIAFELGAIAVGLNGRRQLHRDEMAGARARRAVARILAG
jgi:AcrR family transcriptional regulator